MLIITSHLLFLIMYLLPAATAQPNFTIAKPNCTDRCGTVPIPFPFGTTPACFRDTNYQVTCNYSSNPPKLLFQNTSDEIADISLDGQLRILKPVAVDCHSKNGTHIDHDDYHFKLPTHFTFNNTQNKFVALGCNTIAYIRSTRVNGSFYVTSCSTMCSGPDDLLDESCGGLGCCQFTSITKSVSRVQLDMQPSNLNDTGKTSEYSNCSYGVLVDQQQAFTFSPRNLTNLNIDKKFPIVVDWAIENETSCNACKSPNSECYMPDSGDGYRCRCSKGYEGNPYLDDGCEDIDECALERYRCGPNEECHNTQGAFECSCVDGYHGDGTTDIGVCIHDERESRIYKLIAGISLGIIVAILVLYLLYLELKRRRSKRMKHMFFLRNGGMLLQEKLRAGGRVMSTGMARQMSSENGHVARIFTSAELSKATNNFRNNMIIGKGGFGIVYKGYLDNKKLVAIKKSKEVDSTQVDQFINEVFVLSQISHRNVVKILGCCLETQVPLLVYEFINNGTLSEHIHNEEKKCFLHWGLRLKIAIETADVLAYLHSTATTPIIHRDVKSCNILLDEDFSAKVSDFGASRLVPMDQSRLSTVVLGTAGYLDPEYMQSNQLTEKSDVYSFGVVLVELITGIKAFRYDLPEEERNLANLFLWRQKERRLGELLDVTILSDENKEQLLGVAKLAKFCLNVDGEDRPSMKEVATELESIRLGGKHSMARLQYNVEEKQTSGSKEADSFFTDESYSATTSSNYSSVRWANANLSGGR